MPPESDPVSRGEFNLLAQQVQANANRIDSIDASGTRGVGIVQTQLTDLAKDVAKIETKLEQHERDHQADAAARASARWKIAALVVAVIGAIDGPLITLLIARH